MNAVSLSLDAWKPSLILKKHSKIRSSENRFPSIRAFGLKPMRFDSGKKTENWGVKFLTEHSK